jgi:hypothetical protein
MMLPRYPNQGQMIVLGWSNQSNLKNWTAYFGTDGLAFLPPNDRNGYTDGVDRPIPTGRVLMSGLNISRQTFPWVSYGQVDYLESTFSGQNVTVAVHKPTSKSKLVIANFNAVCNIDMNQTTSLTIKGNGYEGFVVELVLVEPL